MRPSKQHTFINIAVELSKQATCARRQVGCVLVDINGEIAGTGWNGAPPKMTHCIDTLCPGASYPSGQGLERCEALHAEFNALRQCKDQYSLSVAYVTTAPCISCVKQLAATNLHTIVFGEEYAHSDASREFWLRSGEARGIERKWIKHDEANTFQIPATDS